MKNTTEIKINRTKTYQENSEYKGKVVKSGMIK